jgi:hypothetical protein
MKDFFNKASVIQEIDQSFTKAPEPLVHISALASLLHERIPQD